MNSLHRRLQVGILAGVAASLAIGMFIAHATMRRRLYAELDDDLVEKAANLMASISQEEDLIELDWLDYEKTPPGFAPGIDYYLVENIETGEILGASSGFADWPLLREGLDSPKAAPKDAALPGYREGRSLVTTFNARVDIPDDDDEGPDGRDASLRSNASPTEVGAELRLIVASVDTVATTMLAMRRFMIGLWCLCIALTWLIVWIVIRRNLRPLGALTSRIQSLDQKSAKQRIDIPNLPTELVPVVAELNQLLERIDTTLTRERTLTSNVAHELRTPVAGMLSILEVTLNRLRSREEYRESTQECFDIAKRMHWLVSNLLSVARIEANNFELQPKRIELRPTFQEWWRPFAEHARAREIDVAWEIDSQSTIETDPEFLRVVVSNLFDNATSYTPRGGVIRIAADETGCITVANETIDIKPEEVAHVFDPLWRNSEARENAGTHAGLGLSLCRKIVELLGGKISAAIKESGPLFVVRIEMP